MLVGVQNIECSLKCSFEAEIAGIESVNDIKQQWSSYVSRDE